MNMHTSKLKILMCCHLPLRSTLGGSKVYIEAAECYRRLGHEVTLVGVDHIVGPDRPYMDEHWRVCNLPAMLREYILKHGRDFDVIEYESPYLPFNLKGEIKTILVARSVLLDLHLRKIRIPRFRNLKSLLGLIFKNYSRRKKLEQKINQSLMTMKYADFINVPNPDDRKVLEAANIADNKIIVQPYGLFKDRFDLLANTIGARAILPPKIAFIGTFDNRKGAVDFPIIMKALKKKYPEIRFKFLGVTGMFPDKEAILKYLGHDLSNCTEIEERYFPDQLPEYLKDCSFGIFPSYLESFGFGVLEMMSAGLPVVGYDSPGINMLLLPELTAKAGDINSIVDKFSKLIENKKFEKSCIDKTINKASQFIYENQTNQAVIMYQNKLKSRGSP